MKKKRVNESLSSRASVSSSSHGMRQRPRRRCESTDEEDLAVPWTCKDVDPFTPSIRAARVWFDELPTKSIDGYKDLKATFLSYFMQQKKYVKDPGAPECMQISGFMHGVNIPELTTKTMKEMMTTTAAFIRGETAAASKKKVHAPWKSQDQSKHHASDRKLELQKPDFRN
ncbi:hypothetical protein Tco_0961836 [Tanacetum coccineum]